MNCARLSDAELLRLAREGGEKSFAALDELERRHFPAVRAFAAAGTVSRPAAGELARQSWEKALRQQEDGSASGAVRPYALASVLRTASDWAREGQQRALAPELSTWIERTSGPVALREAAAPQSRPGSLVARAFAGLTDRSQAILWHQTVERDDSALTGQLVGAGPAEVSSLTGRARWELHDSYVRILQDEMQDECRRFHRMALAYAKERSVGIAAELAPHLERCALCSRSVADLGRVQHDCGALLAQSLLPWGGPEYAARGTNEDVGQETFAPGAGVPPVPGTAADAGTATGALTPEGETPEDRTPAARTPHSLNPDPLVSEALATELWRTGDPGNENPPPRRDRHAAVGAAGPSTRMKNRRRADLFVRGTAVAALCGVAAAVALSFAGDDSPKEQPQSENSAPPVQPPSSPSSKAPAPSSTTTTEPAAAKPSKNTDSPSKPGRARPSSPPADGSAVEWLFDEVVGGVTPDTSGNNNDGTLVGASPASTVTGGALRFDGNQFLASDGPLVDTSSSFSVSARVKLNHTESSQTVVSQDGAESSGFLLQYDAEESQWEMRIPEGPSDDVDADADEAVSDLEVEAGEWTHLTGVYDEAAGKVRLYVDGRPGESVDHEEDFASEGDFAVGRGLRENEFFRGLDGTVDDVRAFGKAVSPAEAESLAQRS